MVLLEDKVVTDKCPFCGTHLENKPEAVEGMLPPESLIPFKLDLRDAREVVHEVAAGPLVRARRNSRHLANLGQLSGVYIPYWTYDAMTYTALPRDARRRLHRPPRPTPSATPSGNTVTRTRTVVRTNWYSGVRRGAALLRRRAGVRVEERAAAPGPRAGAVEHRRTRAIPGPVPRGASRPSATRSI